VSAVEGIAVLALERLQVTVDLPGPIDAERLRRAIRETTRSVPELAGRFQPRFWRSSWVASDPPVWKVEEASDGAAADAVEQQRFAMPFDHADPLVVTVVHREGGDRIVAQVSHLLGDGGGTKELMYRIAAAYRRDAAGEPPPEPVPRPGHPLWRLLRGVRITRLPMYLLGVFEQFWALRPSTGSDVPMARVEDPVARCARLHLPAGRIERLKARWKGDGVTVNDLLLAAFARALQALDDGPPGEINLVVTADLRQLLDQPAHVENLSALHSLRLGTRPLPPPAEMVARVRALTRRWKETGLGLATAIYSVMLAAALPARWLTRMVAALVSSGPPARVSRIVLTNMGPIDEARLDFGHGPCTAAYILPPLGHHPALIAGATGCCGAVDLTVAYREPALPREAVEDLVQAVDRELVVLASC